MEHLFVLGARALLAAVFAVAFLNKVRGRPRFRRFTTTIGKLTMLREPAAARVAAAVLLCEASIALLLALPATARVGFLLAGALLSAFIVAVHRAVRGRVFAECGCFGGSAMLSYPILVRNVLLLLVAVPGMVMGRPGPEAAPYPHSVLAVAAGLLAAGGFVRYYDVLVAKVLRRLRPRVTGPSSPAARP